MTRGRFGYLYVGYVKWILAATVFSVFSWTLHSQSVRVDALIRDNQRLSSDVSMLKTSLEIESSLQDYDRQELEKRITNQFATREETLCLKEDIQKINDWSDGLAIRLNRNFARYGEWLEEDKQRLDIHDRWAIQDERRLNIHDKWLAQDEQRLNSQLTLINDNLKTSTESAEQNSARLDAFEKACALVADQLLELNGVPALIVDSALQNLQSLWINPDQKIEHPTTSTGLTLELDPDIEKEMYSSPSGLDLSGCTGKYPYFRNLVSYNNEVDLNHFRSPGSAN